MYKGKSLQELAKELARRNSAKRDFRTPTDQMTVLAKPGKVELEVGDKFHGGLTTLMHDQLGSFTKMPANYYDRLLNEGDRGKQMLADQLNYWLRKQKETRLVRTLDGEARAFLSNRYRPLDDFDIANAALPVFVGEAKKLGGLEIRSCDVTDKRLYIKVISNRLKYEVKKGDVVRVGISLSNSEVGLASLRIEPFLDRCICDNGAIIEDLAARKYHVGRSNEDLDAAYEVFADSTRKADDKAFVMKLQDVIRASFDDVMFEQIKGMTVEATTRKIKAPIQEVVEEVTSNANLSEAMGASFLNNLIEGGDISQWGLANAITAEANKAESYEMATRLEKLGGEVMSMPPKKWKELADYAVAA